MKKAIKQREARWPGEEQLEQEREKLRRRIVQEELECALRLEVVNRLMADLKVDAATFRALWIEPLVIAGVSLDVALLCIAKSHHQPN